MCGIAGIINFNGGEEKQALLRRMIGLMRHRGPDSAGIYSGGAAGLAHARLSIIDLSGGDQPIHNEDQTVWVVFNGEIFNYPELRKELIESGHRFYTHSDTEVLVHLYEEYQTEMFQKLNGQFAFAIWDQKSEKLLLGRDRVGIRPLFYHQNNGRLVFGSEIKSIFADQSISRRIDVDTLSDIFTCWTPTGGKTIFEDVCQLPPAHFAVYSPEGMQISRYWHLPFEAPEADDRPLSEWVQEMTDLLTDAARIRLRADVPVGAYLSGGIDSTFISSLVKRNFNNRLCTFSVGFADKRFDEKAFQETAVKALGTEHRSVTCTDSDIGEIFPRVVWHTETPIIRTAPAPLMHLSKLVRESDFKVVLTGEGADEIFAGYNIFKEDKVRRFWAKNPASQMRPSLLAKLYPYVFSQGNERAKKFLVGFFKKDLEKVDSPAYSHLLRWQNTSQLKMFFSDDLKAKAGSLEEFVERFRNTLPEGYTSWPALSRAQYIENTLFLSNYLLSSQGDRMAMANSVEGRYPFLDHRVVEFACRIPSRYRLNGLTEKFILKQAARGFIPDQLIDRAKQPYRAPISNSFFGESSPAYVMTMLSEETIKDRGYFNPQKVASLVRKCGQQKGNLLSERENMALVAILSTQLLDHMFIRNFPAFPVEEPKDVKLFQPQTHPKSN